MREQEIGSMRKRKRDDAKIGGPGHGHIVPCLRGCILGQVMTHIVGHMLQGWERTLLETLSTDRGVSL